MYSTKPKLDRTSAVMKLVCPAWTAADVFMREGALWGAPQASHTWGTVQGRTAVLSGTLDGEQEDSDEGENEEVCGSAVGAEGGGAENALHEARARRQPEAQARIGARVGAWRLHRVEELEQTALLRPPLHAGELMPALLRCAKCGSCRVDLRPLHWWAACSLCLDVKSLCGI